MQNRDEIREYLSRHHQQWDAHLSTNDDRYHAIVAHYKITASYSSSYVAEALAQASGLVLIGERRGEVGYIHVERLMQLLRLASKIQVQSTSEREHHWRTYDIEKALECVEKVDIPTAEALWAIGEQIGVYKLTLRDAELETIYYFAQEDTLPALERLMHASGTVEAIAQRVAVQGIMSHYYTQGTSYEVANEKALALVRERSRIGENEARSYFEARGWTYVPLRDVGQFCAHGRAHKKECYLRYAAYVHFSSDWEMPPSLICRKKYFIETIESWALDAESERSQWLLDMALNFD